MDILQQDRKEATEQRQEMCDTITRLQGELEGTEEQMEEVRAGDIPRKKHRGGFRQGRRSPYADYTQRPAQALGGPHKLRLIIQRHKFD